MYKKLLLISFLLISLGLKANEISFAKPEQFIFGSSLNKVKSNLESFCSSINVEKIIPITAPLAKKSQTQINCSGFIYGGKKRVVELVFQDDQLDIVWILFPEVEKLDFKNNFEETYGSPTMEIEFGTIFLQANAAIRNNPSEVLFASNRQVKVMLNKLKQQKSGSE